MIVPPFFGKVTSRLWRRGGSQHRMAREVIVMKYCFDSLRLSAALPPYPPCPPSLSGAPQGQPGRRGAGDRRPPAPPERRASPGPLEPRRARPRSPGCVPGLPALRVSGHGRPHWAAGGFSGPAGATGPQGPQAPPDQQARRGRQGPLGPLGPQGIWGMDGPTSGRRDFPAQPGATGPQGPRAPPDQQARRRQVPPGPTGPQGIRGMDGPTGP